MVIIVLDDDIDITKYKQSSLGRGVALGSEGLVSSSMRAGYTAGADCGDTWEQIPLRFPIIYALAIQ
jgi:hypothetical protein